MSTDPKQIRALRRKAEKLLAKAPEKLALMPGTDLQELIHGLSVYQIELEMQNEELRKSREQLEESRGEYADLYDFAPVGYLTFDKTGLVTRANLTATGLFGIERSLLVKKPFSLFIHPDSQDTFYFHKRQVLETRTTQVCQLVLTRKDGTFFDAQLESVAVQVNGRPAVNSIVIDITERVRAEGALREIDNRLKLALTSAKMGIWEWTPATNEVFWSPESYEILGSKDIKGTFESFTNILHPEDAPRLMDIVGRVSADHPVFQAEFRIVRPDGAVRWLANTGQGYFDRAGVLLRMIGTVQDITERREIEERLRTSEERHRSYVEVTGELDWTTNRHGEVVEDLPLWRNFTGQSFEEIKGAGWAEALHPDDVERAVDAWHSAVAARSAYEVEYRVRRHDGVYRHFVARGVPLCDRDGSIREWVGTCIDITGRIKAEVVTRRLASFPELNPNPVLEVDASGEVTFCNPATRAALTQAGMSEGDSGAFVPEDLRAILAAWDRQTTLVLNREVPIGDRVFDEAVQLIPHLNVTRIYGRDITARKKAETLLRESEERFRNMFDRHKAVMLLIEPETGAIVDANIAATGYYGYSRDELCSMHIQDINQLPPGQTARERLKAAREQTNQFVFPHRLVSGTIRWVEVYSTPFEVQGKTLLFSIIHDITERKKAEAALSTAHAELERRIEERTEELQQAYDKLVREGRERQQLEARLRQAHKMEAVGTLAGGIAHDFNNILAAIIGFSEMAQEKSPEGSPARRHMERVFRAGMRGRDLIKQILTFSRQTEQEKQPLKLVPVINEALGLLRASLPSTIDIQTNLQRTLGFVLADPIQIQQIVMNLCTNAAHAMRHTGGVISIDLAGFSFSSPGDAPDPTMSPGFYARLSVRDTGEGMSPETIEHIYDPFFTTRAAGEGTGLGLSVIHGIVVSHEGTITVESEPGKGSTFTVYLPKFIEEQHLEPTEGDGPIPRGHERILFIDDEADLAAMGDEMLTDLGYHVTSRTTAREALALFRLDPSRFDLVITDQTMPELTGEDLAKEILAVRADKPVIMCTGFSPLVDADAAKAAGIKAFIMKPLTKREIAKTIRKVLDGQGG